MSTDKTKYPEVNQSLTSFFEEILPAQRVKHIDERNRDVKDWITSTYSKIIKIKKDQDNLYQQVNRIFSKELPKLNMIFDELANKNWFIEWERLVLDVIDALPETVSEMSDEQRFRSQLKDSLWIKAGKTFKRIVRRLHLNSNIDKQSIPLRQLVRYHLLFEEEEIKQGVAIDFEELSELLALFFEKPAATADKESEGKVTRAHFKIEVIDLIEKHLEQVISRLEDKEKHHRVENWVSNMHTLCREKAFRADTFEQPVELYKNLKREKVDKIADTVKDQQFVWIRFLKSQVTDLEIQAEIAGFGYEASEAQKEILEQTHRFFRDFCYLPMEAGVDAGHKILEKLKESKKENLSKTLVNQFRKEIQSELTEALLTPMRDENSQAEILQSIQKSISYLLVQTNRFSDVVEIAEKREAVHPVPKIETDEFKWREIATRFLKQQALRDMDPESQELIPFIREMAKDVEEAIRIVDVNLMAALDVKSKKEEEQSPLDIATGGLERAIKLFEETIKKVRDKQNEYEEVLEQRLPGALKKLAEVMLTKDYDRFEIQDKALQVKATALDWRQKTGVIIGDQWERFNLFRRFITQKIKKGKNSVSNWLGLSSGTSVSDSERRNLTQYLSRIQQEDQALPFVYKRLFDESFEIDERFYMNPDHSYRTFEDAFESWKKGLDSNVLVRGEKGSGKSTLFRIFERKYLNDEPVIRINFESTFYTELDLLKCLGEAFEFKNIETAPDFIEKIHDRKKGSVVIVENLHNAFIRNVNGFQALDVFWVIMSSTRSNLFWMVSSLEYAWKFFEKMAGADQYFTHIIDTGRLDKDKIKNGILMRHTSTGYDLIFEPDPILEKSRAYRKIIGNPEEVQEYLSDRFFERLSKVSEGNMSIAMIFWMQSIAGFDETSFTISPLEIAEVDKLEVPSREVLFTLSALAIHDILSVEQMSMALHQDKSDSQLMLTRLKSKWIVVETNYGYKINQLVYRQIVRLLQRKNILH